MKTLIYFLLTCFISTGALMGALYSKAPVLLYIVGFGIWALFLRGLSRRMKKNAERKEMEHNFRNFMRCQSHKRNH